MSVLSHPNRGLSSRKAMVCQVDEADGYQRLAAAMVVQGMEDANESDNWRTRQEARAWLRDTASWWMAWAFPSASPDQLPQWIAAQDWEADAPPFSPRKLQVIDGIMAGQTNVQIAESLGIRRHTVNEYARRMYIQVGVPDRKAFKAWVAEQGWWGATPD